MSQIVDLVEGGPPFARNERALVIVDGADEETEEFAFLDRAHERFIGRDAWLGEPIFHPAKRVSLPDGRIGYTVGPQVTRRLRLNAVFRITSRGGLSAEVVSKVTTFAPASAGSGIGFDPPPPAPGHISAAPPPAAPIPEPAPASPIPEPAAPSDIPSRVAPEPPPAEVAPQPAEPEPPPVAATSPAPATLPDTPAPPRIPALRQPAVRQKPWDMIALVVLALLGIGAYLLYRYEQEEGVFQRGLACVRASAACSASDCFAEYERLYPAGRHIQEVAAIREASRGQCRPAPRPQPAPAPLPAPAPAPAPASYSFITGLRNTNGDDDWLAFRSEPRRMPGNYDVDFSRANMRNGTLLTVLGQQGEFYNVRLLTGQTGWATSRFISCCRTR